LSEAASDTTGNHTQQNRTPQGVPAYNRWLSNATPPDCPPIFSISIRIQKRTF
jgi:hypothetical protein